MPAQNALTAASAKVVRLGPGGSGTFLPARYCVIMIFMAKQETVTTKKRRGPAPTGRGHLIGLRWHEPDLERIDTWRKQQDDLPSRSEAIRRLVELGLKGKAGK